MPDLDVLSSEYTGVAAAAGTGGAGGAGGAGGTGNSADGGTNPTGGTGGTGAVGGDTSVGGDAGMLNEGGGAGEPPPVDLPQCENLMKDPNESDVDCGGSSQCRRCETKSRCTANKDCASSFCKSGRCAEPTCSDTYRNQDETGVDCGGSCAPELTCDLDVECGVNEDCTSQYCKNSVCTDHCTSGKKEADETDKDCGGADCGPCDAGAGCKKASDCTSKICNNNECQPATCTDHVLNQDESDQDCGGACTLEGKACAISADCNFPEDCASVVCDSMHQCAPDDVVIADMIDDFEDGNLVLPTPGVDHGGRIGNWYAYGDLTGIVTADIALIPGKRTPASTKALRSTGQDFTSWGSGVGVDLNNSAGTQQGKLPWDASAYVGVTFWAHAAGALNVTVAMPDSDTDPSGGRCDQANQGCDHHYIKPIQVDAHWRRYTVYFADLVAEPGTQPPPVAFVPAELVSVQFRMASGQTYELWIDDLAFVTE
jgi:hypothetical protein